jgi:uncharacterized protein (TIGR00730 family)
MPTFRRVCVFCGSSLGADPAYAEAARATGKLLAERRLGLVYGGGKIGLMGELADAALRHGGNVTGVITRHLEAREVAHLGLTQLRVVETMHERKAVMGELADAFVVLPGGMGTLDEMFEVATWAQLGIHSKPVGLLNVRGYFQLLDQFLARAVEEHFLRPEHRALVEICDEPVELLDLLTRRSESVAAG